jgi:hypothetical protein
MIALERAYEAPTLYCLEGDSLMSDDTVLPRSVKHKPIRETWLKQRDTNEDWANLLQWAAANCHHVDLQNDVASAHAFMNTIREEHLHLSGLETALFRNCFNLTAQDMVLDAATGFLCARYTRLFEKQPYLAATQKVSQGRLFLHLIHHIAERAIVQGQWTTEVIAPIRELVAEAQGNLGSIWVEAYQYRDHFEGIGREGRILYAECPEGLKSLEQDSSGSNTLPLPVPYITVKLHLTARGVTKDSFRRAAEHAWHGIQDEVIWPSLTYRDRGKVPDWMRCVRLYCLWRNFLSRYPKLDPHGDSTRDTFIRAIRDNRTDPCERIDVSDIWGDRKPAWQSVKDMLGTALDYLPPRNSTPPLQSTLENFFKRDSAPVTTQADLQNIKSLIESIAAKSDIKEKERVESVRRNLPIGRQRHPRWVRRRKIG